MLDGTDVLVTDVLGLRDREDRYEGLIVSAVASEGLGPIEGYKRRARMIHSRAHRSFILRQAGLREACEFSCGADLRVGLIDGAVNTAHHALSGCRITVTGHGESSVAGDHATFGASILVANPQARQEGSAMGLCPGCALVNVPAVCDAMLDGRLSTRETARRLARAIDRVVAAGCRIVLFGIAIRSPAHPDWSVLREALRRAAKADVLAIIPAGNSPSLGDGLQSTWDEVLTVASTDWRGTASLFSPSLGPNGSRAFAPGEDIPGASGASDVVVQSGSSGAAAIAAGAVAIGCSIEPGRSPFDVAGDLFPPPHHLLNGAKTARRRLDMELSYGT